MLAPELMPIYLFGFYIVFALWVRRFEKAEAEYRRKRGQD